MKRGFSLLFCALLALIFTSCLGPGSGLSGNWMRVYDKTFTVTDATGAVVYTKEKFQVRVEIPDISKPQMDITFINFRLLESDAPIALTFKSVPFTVTYSEDGRSQKYVIDEKSAVPYIEGVESPDYEVAPLQGELSGREGVTLRLTMKNKPYKVEFTNPKQ